MEPKDIVLYAALLPAAAAVATAFLWRAATKGRPVPAAGPLLAALLAGYVGTAGMPDLVPKQAAGWLPHLALMAAGLGFAATRGGRANRFVLPCIAAVATAALSLKGLASPGQTGISAALVVAAVIALTHEGEADATTGADALPFLGATAVAGGLAAATITVSGYLSAGLACGVVAAAAGGLIAILRWVPVTAAGSALLVAVALTAPVLHGALWSELKQRDLILLCGAAWTACVATRRSVGGGIARRTLIHVIAAAALAGAAAGFAFSEADLSGY